MESSSEEEEDDADAAVDAAAEEEAELAAAWGAGALAANPDEDVPVVSEDTSRCSCKAGVASVMMHAAWRSRLQSIEHNLLAHCMQAGAR